MSDTLRLIMPQWQGGNNPPYSFGAKLLAWLAPEAGNIPQVEVPVVPYDGSELPTENGVFAQTVLLQQQRSARKIIEAHQPERIIVFGGDCLVSQAPFAYLNEKYHGKPGVLWLDSHPDVSTPEMYINEHAMVLGNLLGEGDPVFSKEVKMPLNPELIMYGGLRETSPEEAEIVSRLKLRKAGPEDLADDSGPVLQWIQEKGIEHLAIHFDMDVLDPTLFRSLLFSNPDGTQIDAPSGKMTLSQILKLIGDVSQQTDVVGLSIAEYLPWDALNLHNFLASLPIFK
ncbi:arginase family protein [Lacrimispora sp.]|uniref:arginase family protein n=1 Tax=Lacrimispora sp. TaxID=2719234 RepID=UPI003460B90A